MNTQGHVKVVNLHREIDGVKGKRLTDWTRGIGNKKFLAKLSVSLEVSVTGTYGSGALIEYERGGSEGVWVHPLVAVEYSKYLVSAISRSTKVYVINAIGTTYHKIGVTTDIDSRLSAMQVSSPLELKVLLLKPSNNAVELELYLHTLFSSKRVRGEWFDLTADDFHMLQRKIKHGDRSLSGLTTQC